MALSNFFKTPCRSQRHTPAYINGRGVPFAATFETFFMKQNVIAAVAVLLLAACTTARKAANQNHELNGRWRLAVFMPSQKKTLAEVFGERVVEMQFDVATNRVTGNTGCNQFSGTYTADTAHLTFPDKRVLTRMACPGYDENLFLNALNQVNRYRLIESELELRQNDTIIMIFSKRQE